MAVPASSRRSESVAGLMLDALNGLPGLWKLMLCGVLACGMLVFVGVGADQDDLELLVGGVDDFIVRLGELGREAAARTAEGAGKVDPDGVVGRREPHGDAGRCKIS